MSEWYEESAASYPRVAPMALRQQTLVNFRADVPVIGVLDRQDVPEELHGNAATGGGLFEASRQREGHQICWRAYGALLELSETTTVPGVQVRGADLWLRFGGPLVPSAGLAQLGSDGSLLLSVATRCPEGGVYVYQLQFELPTDPEHTGGAVTTRDSWFAAVLTAPEHFMYVSTPAPVGASLGHTNQVCFDAVCAAPAPPGAMREHAQLNLSQLMLLASDGGAAAVHVRNEGMQALMAAETPVRLAWGAQWPVGREYLRPAPYAQSPCPPPCTPLPQETRTHPLDPHAPTRPLSH